jgi:hypothetical protein
MELRKRAKQEAKDAKDADHDAPRPKDDAPPAPP